MSKPMLLTMPLLYGAMVFVMVIKLKKSPLDLSTSHHGHQELVKGITTEYSGPALAVIEISHWYESIFLLGLMFLFCKQNMLLGMLSAVVAYLCAIIVDNTCARLTWQWMLKVTWGIIIELCAVNILFLYYFKMLA
jgi:ech hydrogenase subunit B